MKGPAGFALFFFFSFLLLVCLVQSFLPCFTSSSELSCHLKGLGRLLQNDAERPPWETIFRKRSADFPDHDLGIIPQTVGRQTLESFLYPSFFLWVSFGYSLVITLTSTQTGCRLGDRKRGRNGKKINTKLRFVRNAHCSTQPGG